MIRQFLPLCYRPITPWKIILFFLRKYQVAFNVLELGVFFLRRAGWNRPGGVSILRNFRAGRLILTLLYYTSSLIFSIHASVNNIPYRERPINNEEGWKKKKKRVEKVLTLGDNNGTLIYMIQGISVDTGKGTDDTGRKAITGKGQIMESLGRYRIDCYRGQDKGSRIVMHQHVTAISAEAALRGIIGVASTWFVDTRNVQYATAVNLDGSGGRYCGLVAEPE